MIYADHHATTPPLPEVVAAVSAALAEGWGNPSARNHAMGRRAADLLEAARTEVAALLGGHPDGIVFTSGATEALNLAILGLGERLLGTRRRIVVGATEHPAVLAPARRLAEAGAELVVVGVDRHGRLDAAALASAIDAGTGLVCIMLANHETGVIHDVAAAADLAHAQGALLVCDATQAAGRLPIAAAALGADAIACSAHKLYGPPGAGALWLARGLAPAPQLFGGGQEGGRRPGTPNLPGLAGFGVACRAATAGLADRQRHLRGLTARLEARLAAALPGLVVHGAGAPRAPGSTMMTLPGLPRGWLAALAGVAASGGAACSAGEPSASLLAMGVPPAEAANAIRLGLGIGTTAADADAIADAVAKAARQVAARA